jgi:hypothetical protein
VAHSKFVFFAKFGVGALEACRTGPLKPKAGLSAPLVRLPDSLLYNAMTVRISNASIIQDHVLYPSLERERRRVRILVLLIAGLKVIAR